MRYLDKRSIIIPDGDELVELQVTKQLGAHFASSECYAAVSDLVGPSILCGKFNLNPNATTTVVPAKGVTYKSYFAGDPVPLTLNAGMDRAASFYTMGDEKFTVTHASVPHEDREFSYVIYLNRKS